MAARLIIFDNLICVIGRLSVCFIAVSKSSFVISIGVNLYTVLFGVFFIVADIVLFR